MVVVHRPSTDMNVTNTRLLVHVEGQTEETFVNEILRRELSRYGYMSVDTRLMGNARRRSKRGGIASWSAVRRDIVRHLKNDRNAISTTMVDYYGMPQSGGRAWPGRAESVSLSSRDRAQHIEEFLARDIQGMMGRNFNLRRFIPFVMMHEFEALLFSDCAGFVRAIERPKLLLHFQRIRQSFDNPEEIDDSRDTAPSRRIMEVVPEYEKPLYGVLSALEIGLESMLTSCPHFSSWWDRLIRATIQ